MHRTPRLVRVAALAAATLAIPAAEGFAADKKAASPLPGVAAPSAQPKPLDPKNLPKPTEEEISEVKSILFNADLLVACERGDAAKVKELLAKGCDPNAARTSGATALSYAVAGRHTAVARLLLEAKADPNRASFGLRPLFLAAENGDVDTVKLLIQYGADVNARLEAVDEEMKVRNGDTPLIAAASPNVGTGTARALLAAGADVNARADNGKTAVLQAVASENVDVLRLLLEKKPDLTPRMAPPEEIDALTLAVGNGRADMVAMLIAAGANPHVKIDDEVSLLEFAILSDQPKIAETLRKAGVAEPSPTRLAELRQAAAQP